MSTSRRSMILGLATLGCWSARALAGPPLLASPSRRPGSAAIAPLQAAIASRRFVAYHPTGGTIWNGIAAHARASSIEADLRALRPWFDGLITYGASNGTEQVADIAARLGYGAMIQGVWDPGDVAELNRALAAHARHPKLVVGLSLGNEIVLSQRGTWGDIGYAIRKVRAQAPGLALSTTEAFPQFLNDAEALSALREMDFLLANIHPIFQDWFFQAQADNWAEFVLRVTRRLGERFPGPVLVKETGVPTGPNTAGFNAHMQRDFYRALARKMAPSRARAFCYFAAFDLPWAAYDVSPVTHRAYPHEGHWGLFTVRREPKLLVHDLSRVQRV